MRYVITLDSQELTLDLIEQVQGGYQIKLVDSTGTSLDLEVIKHTTGYTMLVNHRVLDVIVDGSPPDMLVYLNGRALSVRVESARRHAAAESQSLHTPSGPTIVFCPMPGKVVKLLVDEGQVVEKGAPLLVVEAMKMENEVCAERAGTVAELFVRAGDAVEAGARLAAVS